MQAVAQEGPYLLLTDPQPLLRPAAVAAWLGVSVKALEVWRGTGEGPPYVKFSRKVIRYRREDVVVFIETRLKAHTASP